MDAFQIARRGAESKKCARARTHARTLTRKKPTFSDSGESTYRSADSKCRIETYGGILTDSSHAEFSSEFS